MYNQFLDFYIFTRPGCKPGPHWLVTVMKHVMLFFDPSEKKYKFIDYQSCLLINLSCKYPQTITCKTVFPYLISIGGNYLYIFWDHKLPHSMYLLNLVNKGGYYLRKYWMHQFLSIKIQKSCGLGKNTTFLLFTLDSLPVHFFPC